MANVTDIADAMVTKLTRAAVRELVSYELRREEERQDKEFWRTNSLPTSGRFSIENGDPSITVFDDTSPQIILSSDGSLKLRELHTYALNNMWDQARSIYDGSPDMVRIPLTGNRDTALHIAASANNTDFVRELVNYEYVTAKDLELPNTLGHTVFSLAAITGNSELLQIIIGKNENLPMIRGQDEMLPVHMAALTANHQIVKDLCAENILHKMDFKDIQRLFFMTIDSGTYDVATELVEKYPERLSIARDDKEGLTALHLLARKSPQKFYMQENKHEEDLSRQDHQLELVQKLWAQVRQLESNEILELITTPSVVLFDGVESGYADFVKLLLSMNSELLMIKDPKTGQNLLHCVVLYRQGSIFRFIHKMVATNLVVRAVDKDHNNILHFAAKQLEVSSYLSASFQMKRELLWFKHLEKNVPWELKRMRNKEGKTPIDLFDDNHKELFKEVKKEANGIAKSGMVVATLIATVVFAASFTVPIPGDKNSASYNVFILADTFALITSASSVLCFMSILTSSNYIVSSDMFSSSLNPTLSFGRLFLFVAVASMVVTFAAASSYVSWAVRTFRWCT